ncbi:MAG: hypothetical protein NC402_07205 [Prevotella sp.]|nr:hypothetical protein [Prevotella sp.]MCM1074336.1 hypothetical protein [Ruminococcus sp.]
MNKKYIHILVSMFTVVVLALTAACNNSHRDDDDEDDDKDRKEDSRSGRHRDRDEDYDEDYDDDDSPRRTRYSDRAGEKMYNKYQDGTLTESDYTTMIDWMQEAFRDANERAAEAVRESSSESEFKRDMRNIESDLERDWPNFNEIAKILNKSSESEMGSSNYRRFNRIKDNFEDRSRELQEKAERKFSRDSH